MDHFTPNIDKLSQRPLPNSDPDWCLALVDQMLSGLPRSSYNNLTGAIATLAVILEDYLPEIVEAVTNPKTGLQTRLDTEKYEIITPSRLKEACEAEAARQARIVNYAALPPPSRSVWAKVPDMVGDGGSGTIYGNYDEAAKRHGRPYGVFEHDRHIPYRG